MSESVWLFVSSGLKGRADLFVLEKLTHEDESVTRLTLGELAEHAGGDGPEDTPFSDLSVLAVRAP